MTLTLADGSDSMITQAIPTEGVTMAQNGTVAYTSKLPQCTFCKIDLDAKRISYSEVKDAEYDFKTDRGPWAYGCQKHWENNRLYPDLGVGKGQRLELSPNPSRAARDNLI